MDSRIKFLILATVAMTAAALFAQQPNAARNPLGADPAAVAAGQQIYNGTCTVCHGPAGQGDRGPALNTPTLAHGSDDGELFRTIRNGIPNSQMAPFAQLTDTQTWQLVSYIRSLQGIAPAAGAAAINASAVPGDVAAGETVFYGKAACATCHEVNGRGGITGPDLSNAGRLPVAALRQKIVDPNNPLPAAPPAGGARGGGAGFGGRGGGAPSTLVVKMPDGKEIRGVRRNEDTFTLQMVDAAGQLSYWTRQR